MKFIQLKDKTFVKSFDFENLNGSERFELRERVIKDFTESLGIEYSECISTHETFTHFKSKKDIIGVFFCVNNKDNYTLILTPPKSLNLARKLLKSPNFLKYQRIYQQ
ncbi:hypothetical protein [Helicobacter cetorum]|uniref:hypothetical protein n=1 Tax=Helicobacter cetorum TaxID=138563 RepID=UPI0018F82F61|nr:hypothetical protein [Helicobacter cetorum]